MENKRTFQDNEQRKKRISEGMKVYHHNLRHGLNEDAEISFEDLKGADGILEDKYISLTSNVQSLFIRLVDMIEQRRELSEYIKFTSRDKMTDQIQNNSKKIHISPEQRDRIFEPNSNVEEQ